MVDVVRALRGGLSVRLIIRRNRLDWTCPCVLSVASIICTDTIQDVQLWLTSRDDSAIIRRIMWGRIIRIVGLVLLAVIVASVVSPWFDLEPTNLRPSRRVIIHFNLAFQTVVIGALPVSLAVLAAPHTVQSHQTCDIVARDCARLC